MANISDNPVSPSTIVTTRSKCQKTLHDTVSTEQYEPPTGKLPVQKDACCMLYLFCPDRVWKVMHTINETAVLLSNAMVEHCNVYTIAERHTVKKICGVYNEFKNKCQTKMDRKTDKWREIMSTYNHQLKSRLFDISRLDRQHMRNVEDDIPRVWLLWGPERVTISYCTSFVDRKWEKTTQRRQKDQLSYKRMK